MGLVKVLLAMRDEEIPGNLHFHTPNPNIPELLNGKIKVVSENRKWDGGIVGISSFGESGIAGSYAPQDTTSCSIAPKIEWPCASSFNPARACLD